jgi:hypothetical protein
MNNQQEWGLVDIETGGVAPPIYTVELDAQRMLSWRRPGPPLRRLQSRMQRCVWSVSDRSATGDGRVGDTHPTRSAIRITGDCEL